MTTFGEAVAALRHRQKTSRGVSFYTRWINRPGGRVIAAAAHSLGLTPNQVSLLSGALSLCGIILAIVNPPTPATGVLVWILLAVGFMTDSADGQLARLRGGGTLAGEWLDHVLDTGKTVALHSGVLVGWYLYFDLPPALLLIPLAFQLAAIVAFVAGTLTELLTRAKTSALVRQPSNIRSALLLPVDYGVFCLVFLTYGFPGVFVVLYTAFAFIRVVYLMMFLFKWFRELSGS